MKIDSRLTTIKNIHRRVVGDSAHFHSLGTARAHQTKDEATADLASMIAFRCEHESAEVKIASVRGHVGVFSYDLYGGIVTRHIWPEGGVSQCSGQGHRTKQKPGSAIALHRSHGTGHSRPATFSLKHSRASFGGGVNSSSATRTLTRHSE